MKEILIANIIINPIVILGVMDIMRNALNVGENFVIMKTKKVREKKLSRGDNYKMLEEEFQDVWDFVEHNLNYFHASGYKEAYKKAKLALMKIKYEFNKMAINFELPNDYYTDDFYNE